jgi:Flp pilus assembly protein TadB
MAVFEQLGRGFIPQKLRPIVRVYFQKAGIMHPPYTAFALFAIAGIVLTIVLYWFLAYPWIIYLTSGAGLDAVRMGIYRFVLTFSIVVVGIFLSYLSMSIIYIWTDLRIFNRTNEMEKVLVDFLQFVSENLKAGMSFDRALFFAIKPQFTVLAAEVRIAAKRAMTGEDVEDALTELSRKYDSQILSRSLIIIVEALRGGGEVAPIIDRVVENLRETKKLKEEMSATTLGYVIFVSFVVMALAPGLFALAKQLLFVLGKFIGQLSGSINASQSLSFQFARVAITPEQFTIFCYFALATTSIFSSMIISQIQHGNIKSGVKYVPVFAVVSVTVFFVLQYLLGLMVSSFF